MNLTLPNCRCQDGKTPVFAVGKVTTNAKLPASVKIRTQAANSYLLDFNLPGSNMKLIPLTVLALLDGDGDVNDKRRQVTVYVPSDGAHDFGSAYINLLLELYQLQTAINCKVPTLYKKIGSV